MPLAACVPNWPTAPGPGVQAASELAAVSAEIVARTNQARRNQGLPELAANEKLARAAQLHADQMAEAGRMTHTLPDAPYPTLASRAAAAGYQYRLIAENIAAGHTSAAAVMNGWLNSEGHRANVLDPEMTQIGAGVATGADGQIYYVSVFGSPR
jgi:uncharacterized protein YkwD